MNTNYKKSALISIIIFILLQPQANVKAIVDPSWSTGLRIGMWKVDVVLEQTIFPDGGDTPGTLINHTITGISDSYIRYTEVTTRPETEPFDPAYLTLQRYGFQIFMSNGKSHVFTTTNITHLQELLATNTSGIMTLAINDTHFTIRDYFLMPSHHGFPDHYHSYNATYERATGWRIWVELNHVHLDGSLMGEVRMETVEMGYNPLPESSPSFSSKSSDESPLLWNSIISAIVILQILKRKISIKSGYFIKF